MSEKPSAPASKPAERKVAPETRSTEANGALRYPFAFRVSHWILLLTIPFLFATGWSLHAAGEHAYFSDGMLPEQLPSWMPAGRIYMQHWMLALAFAPMVFVCRIAVGNRVNWRRPSLVLLLYGGILMAFTGYILLFGQGLGESYHAARRIHHALGMFLIPLAFLWHLVEGLFRKYRLLVPTFHPWAGIRSTDIGMLIGATVVTTLLLLNNSPLKYVDRTLLVRAIDAPATDDLSELPWSEAKPLNIPLAGGIKFDRGRTIVTLRAFHDDKDLFVLAEWDDVEASRMYQPWRKSDDGWQHMVSIEDDETVHYEDKFSIVFPIGNQPAFERFGCAAYCHVGAPNHYGYKATNERVDVWHWKATRAAPVGFVDDKYWETTDWEKPADSRHGDPKADGGGYAKNVSEDKTGPKFLPDDLLNCEFGFIPREHAVEYTEEQAATYIPGTVIPGIVASAFTGDNGDVTCVSEHRDGKWRVYIRRVLDTGSEFDRKFTPGERIPFACAAFDRASKRHAFEHATYHMLLEE